MNVITVVALRRRHAAAMETKDNFLRFAILGSIVAVGLLAMFVHS